jgi:porin
MLFQGHAFGYDINDKFSVGGVLAGAYQYQSVDDLSGADDTGRGALPIQPEFSFRPTDKDEIFAKFGFAIGNGLNEKSPFNLAPWAADLEDDVKDINGRNRDYLLTAWYKHTFQFSENHALGITGGVIDATDYLDENAYANDEFTQFMNGALVNGPNAFAPSYDIGGAIEWEMNQFNVKGVYMNVGENDDGENFNFFAVQIGYALATSLGEGNYRLIYQHTSDDFLDPLGTTKESRQCLIFSFDQKFGEIIGGWIRFGFGDDDAAVDYKDLYSGGINVSGKLWGREQDNIGLGYGYLRGANTGIDKTQVAEGYVRFGLNDYVAATLDVQYMDDDYDPGAGINVDGWIFGARMTVEF